MASTKEYCDFILEQLPYDSAKPMHLVEDVDDKEKLSEIIKSTIKWLSNKKRPSGVHCH